MATTRTLMERIFGRQASSKSARVPSPRKAAPVPTKVPGYARYARRLDVPEGQFSTTSGHGTYGKDTELRGELGKRLRRLLGPPTYEITDVGEAIEDYEEYLDEWNLRAPNGELVTVYFKREDPDPAVLSGEWNIGATNKATALAFLRELRSADTQPAPKPKAARGPRRTRKDEKRKSKHAFTVKFDMELEGYTDREAAEIRKLLRDALRDAADSYMPDQHLDLVTERGIGREGIIVGETRVTEQRSSSAKKKPAKKTAKKTAKKRPKKGSRK